MPRTRRGEQGKFDLSNHRIYSNRVWCLLPKSVGDWIAEQNNMQCSCLLCIHVWRTTSSMHDGTSYMQHVLYASSTATLPKKQFNILQIQSLRQCARAGLLAGVVCRDAVVCTLQWHGRLPFRATICSSACEGFCFLASRSVRRHQSACMHISIVTWLYTVRRAHRTRSHSQNSLLMKKQNYKQARRLGDGILAVIAWIHPWLLVHWLIDISGLSACMHPVLFSTCVTDSLDY